MVALSRSLFRPSFSSGGASVLPQVQFSLVDRRPLSSGMIEYCTQKAGGGSPSLPFPETTESYPIK